MEQKKLIKNNSIYFKSLSVKIFFKKLNFNGNMYKSYIIFNKFLEKLGQLTKTINLELYIFETAIYNILCPISSILITKSYKKLIGVSLYTSISHISHNLLNLIKKNYLESFSSKLSKEIYNLYLKQGQLYNNYIINLISLL